MKKREIQKSWAFFLSFFFIFSILPNSLEQKLEFAQDEVCGILEENENDMRTLVPWTAAIFQRGNDKQNFTFFVTGTILGPTAILTVFGNAYGSTKNKSGKYYLPNPKRHLIAVGLKANHFSARDKFTQFAEVEYILPFQNQQPKNDQFNLVIFHLKTALKLDGPYAKAACLPLFMRALPFSLETSDAEVRQGGFVYSQRPDRILNLASISVRFPSKEACTTVFEHHYRFSQEPFICGKNNLDNGKAKCTQVGTAPMIPAYNRWFIVGVTAMIPKNDTPNRCNENTVYIYGKLVKSVDWLLNNIRAPIGHYPCDDASIIPLNKVCDQHDDCPNGEDEDEIYCRARNPCIAGGKTKECGVYGPCILPSQVCDGNDDCGDGTDEQNCPDFSFKDRSNITSSEKGKCHQIQISEGVEIECRHKDGTKTNCSEAREGTTVELRCNRFYKLTNDRSVKKTETMECQKDGHWNPPVTLTFGCEPECGINPNDFVPFIVKGQEATESNAFPWHATMFYKDKKNEYKFICGGSLIEKSVMITAAHCVTDSSGSLLPRNNFKIVLGAKSSTYTKIQLDKKSQVFDIKKHYVPPTYDTRTLQSDIAVIELSGNAEFGERVRPICLQSSNSEIPPAGTIGQVPGFGFNEKQVISETLQFNGFPVISPEECTRALKRIPPLQTFCAGFRNGTAVCQGDSGGGMVFLEESNNGQRYFLKGIVSHGEAKEGRLCDPENYAVFTHVDDYYDWIFEITKHLN